MARGTVDTLLRSALKQLSAQRKQLDRQIAALTDVVGDGWNAGAKMLGLSHQGLLNKLKRYGLGN